MSLCSENTIGRSEPCGLTDILPCQSVKSRRKLLNIILKIKDKTKTAPKGARFPFLFYEINMQGKNGFWQDLQ